MTGARPAGAREPRVLWRHLLPNLLPSAAVVLGLLFGQALVVEASLGFLGLGDPDASTTSTTRISTSSRTPPT